MLTTYGGYSKFGHSLVRDSCIIICGHYCWVILSVLLVFSLRGVADSAGILQLPAAAAESVAPNSSAVARAVSVSVLGGERQSGLWSALFSVLLSLHQHARLRGEGQHLHQPPPGPARQVQASGFPQHQY